MTMASVTLVHQGNPMRMRELHSKPLRTYNTPSGRVSLRCVYIHICRYISVFLWLCVCVCIHLSVFACVSLLQTQYGRRQTNLTCCLAQLVSRAILLDTQIYCLPSILAHCLPVHCITSGIARQRMSCCRDKDGVIASLESQLAAARYRITVDERAAKVPSTVDTAGMSLQSQSQVERLQVLNAQLEVS